MTDQHPDPYGQNPQGGPRYGQPPYGQAQYGQPPHGQFGTPPPQYGQPQYGLPPGEYGIPPGAAGFARVPGDYPVSAGAAFGQAWVRFLTNPWPWVGFVAVAFLATVAGSFVPFVGFLVTFAISVFFTPMLARAAYLDATTGRIGFSSFFDFARIGPAIGVAMLVLLGTLVGTLLLVLPGIVFGLAVTFAQPAVAHGRKPIEAIVDSVRIATSNFGQFSIAFLIQLGLSFVGLATFGLGFFAILPLTTLFTTAFYRQAVGY